MNGPLEVLIELAQRRCDEAAKALAAHIALRQQLQHRGALLAQYRREYVARLEAAVHAGIDGASLRNLRRFLARIDAAEAQQLREAQCCAERLAQAQGIWQAAQRKMEAFAALDRRRGTAQALRGRRAEQRLQDEAAARSHRARAAIHHEDLP